MKRIFLFLICIVPWLVCNGNVIIVGPNQTIKTISEAATFLNDGDTLWVEAATFNNDKQITFSQNNILIKGINGRPILEAGSIIANDMSNGKGIFVTKGQNITVENLEFRNCKVQDKNGAGIRQEGCNLIVRNCRFYNNEMGILCGSIPDCKTTIEYSEFEGNGSPDNPGYQHNVYINHIDTLIFQFNVSIDAVAEGHELKSRAAYNFIAYNIIANRISEDSRTIDISNGGRALIIGNVIEQGPNSANSNIIGYGLEGLDPSQAHDLAFIHNTVINSRGRGSFIHIPASGVDSLVFLNNIFAGETTAFLIGTPLTEVSKGNVIESDLALLGFEDLATYNFYITQGSAAIIDQGAVDNITGWQTQPQFMIENDGQVSVRLLYNLPDIGAYEFGEVSSNVEILTSKLPWPNPAHSDIFLPSVDGTYRLFNSQGQLLNVNVKNNIMDISSLPLGIYYLEMDGNRTLISKL